MRRLATLLSIPVGTACLVTLAIAGPVPAQEPTTGGFLFTYVPHDRAAFEAGYRRHLEWHRQQEDSLTWFGWDVLVGPQPGRFVDGFFGAPFAAMDVRVDPAGDQADAATNVLPFADVGPRELIALRPDLGTAAPLEEGRHPAPFVEVLRYAVSPPAAGALESALAEVRERAAGVEGLHPYTVYERVAGAAPGFVVLVWRDRLATFDEHDRHPMRALGRALERRASAGTLPTIHAVESEIWMYRRDLSHLGRGKSER